jgi:hypothetical protein
MTNTAKSKAAMNKCTPALRALRRADRVARKTARMHGTPIYVLRGGKVIALQP